ncbi:MAG TPA: DedA family protein [Candidatus Binataceae bacterium]|nr:DedA family protein [Candidatus Binataceae bacterium]
MHHLNPTEIELLLQQWGYVGIFACVLLGNIGIPLPEESVVLAAGFLAGREILGLKTVILVAFTSAVIGDNLGYLLGRTGGRRVLIRVGQMRKGMRRRYLRFRLFFRAHGDKAVLIARFVAGLRFIAGPMAGAMRMRFWRFLFFNVLGAALWCTTISYLGFVLGDQWERFAAFARHTGNWLMIAAAIAVLALVLGPAWLRQRPLRTPVKRAL